MEEKQQQQQRPVDPGGVRAGYENLAGAILRRAARDLRSDSPEIRADAHAFLQTPAARDLAELANLLPKGS